MSMVRLRFRLGNPAFKVPALGTVLVLRCSAYLVFYECRYV